MTVPQQPTRTTHVGNGVTAVFAYDFLCLAKRDLQVIAAGAIVDPSSYTVSNVGQSSGGDVTFNAAPADQAQIIIQLSVVLDRETDYQTNGDLFAKTINLDFDRIWLAIQQAFGFLNRVPRLSDSDVDGAGAYRAKNNRVRDLGDPIAEADAVNKRSMFSFVADYVDQAIAGVVGGFGSFVNSGPGAVVRTFQDKMRDLRSVKDHADASATDFTTALNNATSSPEVVLLPRRVGGYPLNGVVSPHADATVLSLFSNPVVTAQELEALNLLQFRGGYPCGLPVLSNMRDRKIEVVAGAMRQDTVDRTKWNYITSTYHRPTGILGAAALAIDPFNIQVTYKKSHDEVIFFAAHPDEWMAARKNITVGTSVGPDTTEIQLGGSIEVYAELIFNSATGTWAATGWNDMYNNGHVVAAWNAGTNLLTLTHDYCPELNIRVESLYPANCFAYRRSANATQTVIGFHDANWNAIAPADTMRIVFTKVYNGPIQVDGSANSGTLGLHQGNIWFFGLFGRQ